jgi:hypothetical protein
MFVTAQPSASVRFKRAIERRALWLAEDAARELPNLPLADALHLVRLYAEEGSPKYERAALRWLERYLAEGAPTLELFARSVASLAELEARQGVSGERIAALPGIREWSAIEEDEWDGGDE